MEDQFYFSVWCYEVGVLQKDSWKIHNTAEAQTMQEAGQMFIEDLLKELTPGEVDNIIVWVQDWRGRIGKFEVTVKMKPIYTVKRIE